MAADDVRNGRPVRLSPPKSGLWEAAQRFWQKNYAGDYLGLILLTVGVVLVRFFGEPFHTMFSLDDARVQHPYAKVQTVGRFFLFLYSAGIPLLTIALWTLLFRRDLHKAHVTLLGLVITFMTTLFLTGILKDAIGRPRPDLLSRCKPGMMTPQHELVTIEACTQKDLHRLHDGWRSFPSGHSSSAFAGLGWLALFLASQTHVLRPRASMVSVLVCLAPLLGAAMIAISRLEDYRHGPHDVAAGSLLGFAIAYFNWRRYYPSLLAVDCDDPYDPPGEKERESGAAFQRVRDEEEMFTGEDRFSIGEDGGGGSGGYSREGNL